MISRNNSTRNKNIEILDVELNLERIRHKYILTNLNMGKSSRVLAADIIIFIIIL